ncbi:MAG: cytochrome b [Thiohalocapsa sp.]|uniref:cytochrome b n=1 Tax=Thiohalocapsa sp. TaxID=2497641 RepID=UPI002600D377|nr:cytochrome b [Thiohalocapsa sp.]MCG6941871.1 cytochrome b [Thiohalocapsa sp.]
MQIRNTRERWGAVQQTAHWLVVILVIAQLVVGFIFADYPSTSPTWIELFPVHTTLGLSILILMLLRLGWRGANPVPSLPDTLPRWQQVAARATHWLFYLLLILVPIGGYVLVSAGGKPIPFFGWELPPVIPKTPSLNSPIFILHATGAWVVAVLIVLHAGAALRHEWVLRDNTLRHMVPFLRERPASAAKSERGADAPPHGGTTTS